MDSATERARDQGQITVVGTISESFSHFDDTSHVVCTFLLSLLCAGFAGS